MEKIKLNNIPFYQFEIFKKFPEVVNLASTRIGLGGVSKGNFAALNVGLHVGDELKNVLENRSVLAKALGLRAIDLTCPEQVHRTKIAVATECDKGKGAKVWQEGFAKTDGLITNVKNLPLMVVTADCAAVSYYDPVNEVIGLTHSGKKGTIGHINQKMVQKMKIEFGTNPEELLVGIAPCIYPCCYEVDLPQLIKAELIEAGVRPENIEESNLCTACRTDLFYSHRKENGQTGRFANVLVLKD